MAFVRKRKEELNAEKEMTIIPRLDKSIFELCKNGEDAMTAKEIAKVLKVNKTDVNAILYKYAGVIYKRTDDLHWTVIEDADKFRTLPENHGKKWTEEEEIQLVNEYRLGKTIDWIAKNHKRTEVAVASRLIMMMEKIQLEDVEEELEK